MSLPQPRKGVMALLAAGFLTATALTSAHVLAPITPVQAESQAQFNPANGFADLAERVMPAVISVDVKFAAAANDDADMQQQQQQDEPDDSPFRQFFDQFPQFRNQMPNGQPREPRGGGMAQGSGFIISADGYAVTNNHVVQNADEVMVKFQNGDEFKAEVIGTDPKTDLALIKIKADRALPYVSFSSVKPRVGDWVMAVGNPFGLGGTVTTGIVSALGRDIGSGPYDDFMQIDASINKGNSGGPAFNLNGEVVGINTAIFSPSGGSVGIGFAIPASTAQDVIASLKTNGAVTRGWLGVQIQPVTEDLEESLGLKTRSGAVVADVTAESPALKAGIKNGDTILKLDGKDVADPRDLARKVAMVKPGKPVDMVIVRNGEEKTIKVEIGVMPNDVKMAAAQPKATEKTSLDTLGLRLETAEDGAGVKVTDVKPGSPADDRGIKAGDVILEVAGTEVQAPSDVRNALSTVKAGKKVLMLVRSQEGQRFIAMPVGKG